jgi:hypothetical protein
MNINDIPHTSLTGLINACREMHAESLRNDPVLIVEALTTADKDDLIVTLLRSLYSRQDDGSITRECLRTVESVVTFLVEREAV